MADNVQWIKLKVGMFDGNSFKKIKRAMIGGVSYRDKLTAVWFELLDLAGKGNANGYLIDNNEIPYHTFEEIAIMIDRETEEVELCMQFFINEKMIEIIDNIYCLSNFVKYQNEDGLNRIREQKRIAQAKWRERVKQGLIGCVDEKTSTVDTTDNLHSISISNIYNSISSNIDNNIEEDNIKMKKEKSFSATHLEIFDYWNTKDIIQHKELTDKIDKAITKALKTYSIEQLKEYIDRYAKVIKDKDYFFDTKWTLDLFLSRKNGISDFTDEGSKWISYLEKKGSIKKSNKSQNAKGEEYSAEDLNALTTDLMDIDL